MSVSVIHLLAIQKNEVFITNWDKKRKDLVCLKNKLQHQSRADFANLTVNTIINSQPFLVPISFSILMHKPLQQV